MALERTGQTAAPLFAFRGINSKAGDGLGGVRRYKQLNAAETRPAPEWRCAGDKAQAHMALFQLGTRILLAPSAEVG
jgi:hypothetical protein